MRVFIAPLNWGLGHASRCVPLVRQYLANGDEVVLGGDGDSDSLLLLRHHFPNLRVLPLAPLRLTYSSGNSQVGAMLRAIPRLIRFSIRDHRLLRRYLVQEHFDLVISDNRFGLFSNRTKCVYITHQLRILLPRPWQWLQPLAHRLHARIYHRFAEVWVPDFADNGLSGILSHHLPADPHIRYIGPLSRFSSSPVPSYIYKENAAPQSAQKNLSDNMDDTYNIYKDYDVVAVLSGLEPQRTLLENAIIRRYASVSDKVLVVQGKIAPSATSVPPSPLSHPISSNITLVSSLDDPALAAALSSAKHIIARSGYSTIMDFHALGVLSRAELIPTLGQPEQEYLFAYLSRFH